MSQHLPLGASRPSRLGIKVAAHALAGQVACEANDLALPAVDVRGIAASHGLDRVTEKSDLDVAGELVVDEGRLAMNVRSGTEERIRFTIAHELCHYLVAVRHGVPLSIQYERSGTEAYCNAFASHLLIPRPWLRHEFRTTSSTLSTVREVAERSGTTMVTSASALITMSGGWRSMFLLWRRNGGDWYAPTRIVPGRSRMRRVEASPRTGEILSKVGSAAAAGGRVPVILNGRVVDVHCEMVADHGAVLMLVQPAADLW